MNGRKSRPWNVTRQFKNIAVGDQWPCSNGNWSSTAVIIKELGGPSISNRECQQDADQASGIGISSRVCSSRKTYLPRRSTVHPATQGGGLSESRDTAASLAGFRSRNRAERLLQGSPSGPAILGTELLHNGLTSSFPFSKINLIIYLAIWILQVSSFVLVLELRCMESWIYRQERGGEKQ